MKGIASTTTLWLALLLGSLPLTRADTIYLSTYNLNTILDFDSVGNQSTLATASSGLNYPLGLAFNNSGNLFVANVGNNTIEEFNPTGTGSVFATSGLSYPADLTFDNNGNLFVANAANNTIEEFSSSGGTGSVFATAGSGLDSPFGLAFDSSGNLYVANYDDTILKFTTNGEVSVFANSGLNNPRGLAFDSSGNLFVANAGNNTIEEFNSSGQGSVFTSTNLLNQPIGLAFDSSGNLCVANHGDSDILKFNSGGTGTVFASNLGNANYIAIEVPEPSSLLLLSLGFSLLALVRHSLPASGRPGDGGFHRHRRR